MATIDRLIILIGSASFTVRFAIFILLSAVVVVLFSFLCDLGYGFSFLTWTTSKAYLGLLLIVTLIGGLFGAINFPKVSRP
ncbi:hypothetical protein A3D70_00825 [Candidatus Adlerbacteria bacterium RIFCSPHIGHO2_02_FULL_54_18]|uniref:Uncharacterized protein n=2 Tax=Candidatus Adleribacteriota TaxID=1752736 RepID=A0A1F4Y1V4_9BACT|nr:MAG: hypothetical protein A2949_01480 [Candidatus Adlerbacteria bacterium RIFCSPLOWO2_01_FULL_54_21b]OGC87922.1 MAG: hypothetical protein A3D70_00825 [Candidatus Adlerbacteria bacterium RIFCSPHIGHO2_02_FULL_54_18]